MSEPDYKKKFDDVGIVVVKNFFTSDEVERYRELLEREFVDNKKVYIGYDEVDLSEELLRRMISPRLAEVVNTIFIDPIVLPDFIIQSGNTPNGLITPHYDCQSFVRQGMSNMLENLKYAKIGLYFQDSDKSRPGSIFYIPGSHRNRLQRFIWNTSFPTKVKNYIDGLYKKKMRKSQIPLECQAGDLAIFDGRLLHSSGPKTQKTPQNLEKKIAAYFSVAGNPVGAASFMRAEALKFADELTSNNQEDAMRVGYFFGALSDTLSTCCEKVGLASYGLNNKAILNSKSHL